MICVLATSCMSLVITVCVLQMYHADPQTALPNWIRAMVECMAKTTLQKTRLQKLKMAMMSANYKPDKPGTNGPVVSVYQNGDIRENGYIYGGAAETNKYEESGRGEFDAMISILKEILCALNKSGGAEAVTSDNKIVWRTASEIIDNFFVVLFFITIIVINILMLVVMPNVQQFFE